MYKLHGQVAWSSCISPSRVCALQNLEQCVKSFQEQLADLVSGLGCKLALVQEAVKVRAHPYSSSHAVVYLVGKRPACTPIRVYQPILATWCSSVVVALTMNVIIV